ncbi:MAG: 23S rRNA (guanosine(2251)-2'-O)-methyltransferase RlmB [Oscillospiraceae bacterium]|nr:23S rRNA (guanosine(2251)-2'-O)-methyltransferase RlmB [Oscillospiraceae bacterium]
MAYNNNRGNAPQKRSSDNRNFRSGHGNDHGSDRNERGGSRPMGRSGGYRERHSNDDERFGNSSERYEREERIERDNERDDNGGLIIGRNPVIEALKSGKQIDTIYVDSDSGGSIGLICKMAKERDIVVKQVSPQKLDSMSDGKSHQGVIASGACAEYSSIEEILAKAKEKGTAPFIIICDEIEDPHNLGAIIRTAEAAGVDGVIIPKRRSASLNQTVYKTSAGAASYVPVARVSNLAASIDELKENGVWIYGTDASGEDYTKVDMSGPCAIVIGSEGFGMGRLTKEKCDFLLKLPMFGQVNSLNASVAAGIFMYETVRRRGLKKING